MADQTWKSRTYVMSHETLRQAILRISEHVSRHKLSEVRIVMHGGEPLLAGIEWFEQAAQTIRLTVSAELDLVVQTNGTLIDDAFLTLFRQHNIRVGVSLDGPASSNDRHRRNANGRGSYDRVIRGIQLLSADAFRHLFAGILCTIDLENDPLGTYQSLIAFSPPTVDFLLPHGNWTAPPAGKKENTFNTDYAKWLCVVFDHWYNEIPIKTQIRLFQQIIDLILGGYSRSESIGLSPATNIVVETDGTIEQVDTLKSAFNRASYTGLNVFDHTFDQALAHPDIAARQRGIESLCKVCQQCSVRKTCGGGYYPHRYKANNGFDNPSIYCSDLRHLIRHIRHRVKSDVATLMEPSS